MINKDGVVSNIFFILSQQRSGCNQSINQFSLKSTETISYINGIPQNWYFTNKKGIFKRKHQKNINLENIYESFLKGVDKQDIIAQFIYEKEPQPIIQTNIELDDYYESKVQVEYLNLKDFEQFMFQRKDIKDGILQKFVIPYGEFNHLIECNWSENVILLNKKQNINKLANKKMDPYEKAFTFDGPEFHSSHVPLTSPLQIKSIHRIMENIQKKMNTISFGKYKVNRLVCYFKNNYDNDITFQFCSSVRIDDYLFSEQNKIQNKNQAQIPVKYQCNFQVPEFVNRTFSLYTSKPKKIKCDIKCLNCEKYVQNWQLQEVPYKIIIDYYEKFNKNTMNDDAQKVYRITNESEKQNQNDRIYQKIKEEKTNIDIQEIKLEKFINTQNKKYFQNKEESNQKRIPKIFQIVQFDLTYDNYQILKNSADFRGKLIQICNSCYMVFLGELKIAGKDRIFVKDNHEVIKKISDKNQEFKEMRRKYEINRLIKIDQDTQNRYFTKTKSKSNLTIDKQKSHRSIKQEGLSQLRTQISTIDGGQTTSPVEVQNFFEEMNLKQEFDIHVQKTIDNFIHPQSTKHLQSYKQHITFKAKKTSNHFISHQDMENISITKTIKNNKKEQNNANSHLSTNPF